MMILFNIVLAFLFFESIQCICAPPPPYCGAYQTLSARAIFYNTRINPAIWNGIFNQLDTLTVDRPFDCCLQCSSNSQCLFFQVELDNNACNLYSVDPTNYEYFIGLIEVGSEASSNYDFGFGFP